MWFNNFWPAQIVVHLTSICVSVSECVCVCFYFIFICQTIYVHKNWVTSHLIMKGKAKIYIRFEVNLCIIAFFMCALCDCFVYVSIVDRRLRRLRLIFRSFICSFGQLDFLFTSTSNSSSIESFVYECKV